MAYNINDLVNKVKTALNKYGSDEKGFSEIKPEEKIENPKEHKKSIYDEIGKNKKSSNFSVQSLIASGRRKDLQNNDELGEDVIGYVQKGDFLLAWLMDGASDGIIYYDDDANVVISIRQIAKLLSGVISEEFIKEKSAINLKQFLAKAIEKSLKIWKDHLFNRDFKDVESIINLDAKMTFIACLLKTDGYCEFLTIGDSYGFLYDTHITKIYENKMSPGFLKFFIDKDDEVKLYFGSKSNSISENIENISEYKTFDNISSFLLFSDGCKENQEFMRQLKADDVKLDNIKDTIFYHPFYGADDKSMILGQII